MEQRVTFPSGKLSLEGVLTIPDGKGPFPAVILCHPHPLYGGSMDNNVVNALAAVFDRASIISFKFNFRGVGGSEGEYGQGIGEQEDVAAAITFVTTVQKTDPNRIGLVGYSAGAAFGLPIAARDTRIKALAAVSPPFTMSDFSYLKDCSKPKLFISGSRDAFIPASQLLKFCQTLPEPKECHIIEGADHFWWGYEAVLAAKIASFFSEAL